MPDSIARELATWKERIAAGMAAQEKYANTKDWKVYEDYYLGKYGINLYVNYIFGLARAMTPMVYFRNPRVAVMPRRAELEAQSPVLEAVDNWMIQEIGLKQQLKLLILDNFLYGAGIVKLGYDSEYGFDQDILMPPIATPMGVADMSNETPSQRVKSFIKGMLGQKQMKEADMDKIEYNSLIQPGMPWAMRWPPGDFIIEPGATGIEDAQWCAFRIMRKLDDIKNDAKYENTEELVPGYNEEYFDRNKERMIAREMPSRREAEATALAGEPRRDDWCELWELHDKKTEHIQVGARNHDKFLRNEQDLLQIDGLPAIAVVFNRNPRSFWGVPDARVLQPMQEELNRVRMLQEEYRKSNVRRLITRKAAFDAANQEKFMSDTAVAFIEIQDEAQDLSKALFQLQGFMPADLGQWADQIRADMRELIGMGRNQMGEWSRGEQGGASRGTATEAQIVQQGAQIRVDERRDILADTLSLIIRRCNQMIFKWWKAPKVIRIAGPEGQQWINYTGVDLKGEYDYLIEPDDALPMTRERRRQEALAVYQLMAQDPFANPLELRRWVLDKFEGANPQRLLKPPEQIQQEQQQEQQKAMMEQTQKGGPPRASL